MGLKLVENLSAQAQVEIRLTSLTKRYRCRKAADPEAEMLLFSLGTQYINQIARTAF